MLLKASLHIFSMSSGSFGSCLSSLFPARILASFVFSLSLLFLLWLSYVGKFFVIINKEQHPSHFARTFSSDSPTLSNLNPFSFNVPLFQILSCWTAHEFLYFLYKRILCALTIILWELEKSLPPSALPRPTQCYPCFLAVLASRFVLKSTFLKSVLLLIFLAEDVLTASFHYHFCASFPPTVTFSNNFFPIYLNQL